jgi:hypothetical protein
MTLRAIEALPASAMIANEDFFSHLRIFLRWGWQIANSICRKTSHTRDSFFAPLWDGYSITHHGRRRWSNGDIKQTQGHADVPEQGRDLKNEQREGEIKRRRVTFSPTQDRFSEDGPDRSVG